MGDFGDRGECPECGREIGLVAGSIRYHRDEGEPCSGSGESPKGTGPANALEEWRQGGGADPVSADTGSNETRTTDP